MSRYSPTVTPIGLSPLGEVIGRFGEGFQAARAQSKADERDRNELARQQAQDALKRRIDELNLARLGFTESLPGQDGNEPPGGPVRSLDAPAPSPVVRGKDGFIVRPPGPGSTPWDGSATPDVFAEMQQRGRPAPPPTPGAYVPGQGFAGVPQSRYATPRPVRLPSGGFYDPSLDGQARREEIALRGQQALDLEGERQRGRSALRESVNNNNLVGITLRALLAGENDAASDARDANRSEAHDRRVTEREGGAGATDKPAAEANRIRAAAAVVSALGGSYDKAVDWLENTPEGQAAAQRGLRKDHILAGVGTYLNFQQELAMGAQRVTGGMTTEDALKAAAETRTGVTPRRDNPSGMAGARNPDRSVLPPKPPAAPEKQTISTEEARELKGLGYTDEQIAKKYIIRR